MKAMNYMVILTGIIFLSFTEAKAQNWAVRDAKTVKTLVDTGLLTASEITIMPGEKGQVHTHPAHFFYALTDCKLTVHYTDGTEEKYDIKQGECGYSNPEKPHWTENTGKKPAKFLLVELKEHPYEEMARGK